MPGRARVESKVLSTLSELQALRREWGTLWNSDPAATVFQSFDWVLTWVAHYDHCIARLLVVACCAEGRLVGLAPFYVRRGCAWPPALRTVMLTGTGEPEADEAYAEYMAPLCEPGWTMACSQETARVIAAQRDVAGVELLRVRRETVADLVAALSKAWGVACREAVAGTCYDLPANLEQALGQMSARQRTGMRRKLRKLDAIEGVTLEFADNEAERREFMEQMIALHQERWRGRGRAGVFTSDVFRRFHEALSSRLLQRGQLLLARLQWGGVRWRWCTVFSAGRPATITREVLIRRLTPRSRRGC
jgi:CelD/BcsL family acetyltransferase involved in cellulose biosynthesis